MKLKVLLSFFIVTLISGCSSSSKHVIPPDFDKTKLATVFIYRTNVTFDSLNLEKPFFYVDGKEVGKLGTGQSISTFVTPGNHTIAVKDPFLFMPAFEAGNMKFNAEQGKEYYIRYSYEQIDIATTNVTLQMENKKSYMERK